MAAKDYNLDVIEVTKTDMFGKEVVRIALGKTANATMSVADFEANYPAARAAMHIPDWVSPKDTIQFIQGNLHHHIVNVPPLHKLLPMLDAIGVPVASLIADADLGFDPDNPPTAPGYGKTPAGPGASDAAAYPLDGYLTQLVEQGMGSFNEAEFFYHRVGDYAVAGCR